VKSIVSALMLTAIVNLLAILGVAGYAWQNGWLTPERVREAVAVLTEDAEENADDAEGAMKDGDAAKGEVVADGQTIDKTLRKSRQAEERFRIELERRDRELQDAFALLETRWLELVRQQEQLQSERDRFEAERQRVAEETGSDGIKAEIATLATVDAKTAKALLQLKDDADVVRILMAMDARKRSKIVKQCKTDEERRWIERILEKFHESSVAQAEDLGAG